MSTPTLQVYAVPASGTATVQLVGSRGGVRHVADLPEPTLRRVALRFEAAADMLHDPAAREVRCVCISLRHGAPGRCTGAGDKFRNLGYCYGCRTPKYGTVGRPGQEPDHLPRAADSWEDDPS